MKNDWIRYSSVGIEMAVIVGLSVWAGVAIDKRRDATFPLFTLVFSAAGLTIAIIRMVKTLKD